MTPSYSNGFARGQKLVRYLLGAAIAFGLLALFLYRESPMQQTLSMIASLLMMLAAIVCMVRYCRCPKCGKVIIGGVLVIETCPRCKCNLYTGEKVKKTKKK